ncbi:hypothetical protein BURC_02544 [Burkholderiaceae bacterium]|nr:hypothetical protein BURC_02544 [Burkholderiaceae bacterium]
MITTMMRMGAAGAALAAAMAMGAGPAAAGVLDSLFGKSAAGDAAADKERAWKLDEFTAIRVVEKEKGAPANGHPAQLDPAALRTALGSVQVRVRNGDEPLFDPAELEPLVPVLVRAFSLAGPNEDVLLLSTARRGGGSLATPHAVTARLFVQGEALQFIINDARLEFIEAQRRTHVNPRFVYGSRSRAGKESLHSGAARSVRADWLAFTLGQPAVSSSAGATRPAASPPVAEVATSPSPAAVAVTAPPAAPGLPAGAGDAIEQRLITLKRLRDKNLISEDEYQQKRREVLQKL